MSPLLRDFDVEPGPVVMRRAMGVVVLVVMSVGITLLASIAYTLAAPGAGITYEVTDTDLLLTPGDSFFRSTKAIPLADIVAKKPVALRGGFRVMGTALPGYCVGHFTYDALGTVWQATDCSSAALALTVRGEPHPLVLTPPSPASFVNALDAREPLRIQIGNTNAFPVALLLLGSLLFVAIPTTGYLVAVSFSRTARMRYYVGARRFEVRTLLRHRHWPTAGMRAKKHTARFGFRLFGTALPGYLTGWFIVDGARTVVYATGRRNGVLLENEAEKTRIFVTPRDPDAMLAALELAGVAIDASDVGADGRAVP